MANGHVEIHDPFSNRNGPHVGADGDPESTSDAGGMEDTVEFRLLMAYAQRRRPQQESPPQILVNGGTDANGSPSPQTPAKTEKEEEKKKKKKKKMRRKGWKHLSSILGCIKPQTTEGEPRQMNVEPSDVTLRCGHLEDVEVTERLQEDELTEVANRLKKLAGEIQFIPPEVETDSAEDVNVERMIGLLLREAGDTLNEQELLNASVATELFWNYSFFKLLMTTLLTRMGLRTPNEDSPGPKASPKTQIAVTCEVTSRLSAVNSLPRNRLLDHGARYLQHYYSPWAQQQGGYEEAFYSDDEDDAE